MTRPDQTGRKGRQREGGTNQPPLVGSAKQTWPAYIRSTRTERKKEKEGERTHTHAHITQACEMYKPMKLWLFNSYLQ